MFRYNPKANYQPNGGRYLQILSGKDLYKQTIVMSAMENDTFPARFLNIFVDYPLGKCVLGINCEFKNSTNLLSSLGHLGVHKVTSIQTFDFSTLYTCIPHDLLKSRMNNIINNAFNTKMELHDILTSKLAEIKAISPVIL